MKKFESKVPKHVTAKTPIIFVTDPSGTDHGSELDDRTYKVPTISYSSSKYVVPKQLLTGMLLHSPEDWLENFYDIGTFEGLGTETIDTSVTSVFIHGFFLINSGKGYMQCSVIIRWLRNNGKAICSKFEQIWPHIL